MDWRGHDRTESERHAGANDPDRRLRDCGRAVAERELATALSRLDGLTPAQRRTVARMADRIAAGVLAPALDAAAVDEDAGGDGDAGGSAVARLFEPEPVRDRE